LHQRDDKLQRILFGQSRVKRDVNQGGQDPDAEAEEKIEQDSPERDSRRMEPEEEDRAAEDEQHRHSKHQIDTL
jgi:hypothetical protein